MALAYKPVLHQQLVSVLRIPAFSAYYGRYGNDKTSTGRNPFPAQPIGKIIPLTENGQQDDHRRNYPQCTGSIENKGNAVVVDTEKYFFQRVFVEDKGISHQFDSKEPQYRPPFISPVVGDTQQYVQHRHGTRKPVEQWHNDNIAPPTDTPETDKCRKGHHQRYLIRQQDVLVAHNAGKKYDGQQR